MGRKIRTYFFLSGFLAEDLGKDLDYVLDSVFGALAHCGKEAKAQPLSNGSRPH
jgi:hypothetical protein